MKTVAVPAAAASAPSLTPHSWDRAVALHTRIELVKMAYAELMHGTLASGGAAVAFAVAAAQQFPSSTGWWWLVTMVGISVYRCALAFAFRRAGPTSEEYPGWGTNFAVATSASGIGWGASAWIFPTLDSGTALALVHVVVLAGVAVGSTGLLLPMRTGSIVYLVALMGPLALRFTVVGTSTSLLLGCCVVLFTAYMISSAVHSHRTLAEAVRLRFEREELAEQLKAENARREAHEVELQEARERAESASRAKGEFLATISHEIRTPMNGVLGMLRVIKDTPLTGEQQGYLKTASDSAEALLLLLNDVLDFSKIEAGRLEIERAAFRPAATVKAVGDLLLARARDKGLQFDVHLDANLPGVIMGDATRLRQILVNLLGNAIKFTDRGRVELIASCTDRTSSKVTMQFTVADTGIGINSAALERLFKPFTQADTSMSRRYGGTGLGLAISMRLAQAMGGTLQVHSAVNQGTTFRLLLPCDLPDVTVHPQLPPRPRFVLPMLKGRVLVVEDDAVNQQVIELFLRKINLTPRFALDGEEAIATATAQEFDLVLMDCQLPGIDGLEATRRIRALLGPSPLKIIALTANASTHVREACLAAGMDDFLTKPVRFELLATVLQRHLVPVSQPESVAR